ncbi:MAG: Gfo/Idh/MocA family oxidoreductase [Proteobacteria bacterium]|nr:Gfo/Idh/MocA family oxidoreductase [Pseudomonadota bacterium]
MRVGIVGLGFRLELLAKVFAATVPEFRLVGYVDPEPAGLPGLIKAGIDPGRAYDNIDDLVGAEKLDLLMIGSPNHLHLDHLRIALKHDIRIFCEKPIVTTIEDTFELLKLLRDHGGPDRVIVGLVLRYAPLYVDLVKTLAEGTLGEVASIEASEHIAPYHGAFFMRDWRRYQDYSGSFMLEKCCHDLDLYQGVMGARAMRVASFGGRKSFTPKNANNLDQTVYHRKPSGWMGTTRVFDSDADIIDHQTAIVEYANGASMAFHTNLNVPNHFRRFCVVGTKGTAEGDFVRNYYRVSDAHSEKVLADKSYEISGLSVHYGADEQMIADVVEHLRHGTKLPVSVLDALEAGITAIKIDEARRTRTVVDLAPVWQVYDSLLAPAERAKTGGAA